MTLNYWENGKRNYKQHMYNKGYKGKIWNMKVTFTGKIEFQQY